ncbi:MAG: winged helix-turn-helix transcriptional regulator [Bryobacteraceae bacterium]
MKRRNRKSDCPVHFALEVFGDACTLLIIRDLMFKGRTTYTDFLRAEEGIATNVLADRLARLEENGVLGREARSGRGSGSAYRLTSKGVDLLPIMLEIIGWSAKYDSKTAADRRFVRRLHRDRAGLDAEIRAALVAHTPSTGAVSAARAPTRRSSVRKPNPKEESS